MADPFSVLSIYRPGDFHILPLIYRISHGPFGEFLHYETRGQGWNCFPGLSVFPLAICFRIFGEFGFIICDVLVTIFRWILFWMLLAPWFSSRRASMLLSLVLLILGSFNQLPWVYAIWNWLYPRRFFSNLFYLGFLVFFFRIAQPLRLLKSTFPSASKTAPPPFFDAFGTLLPDTWCFPLLGIFLGIAVQGDVYSGQLGVCLALILTWKSWKHEFFRRGMIQAWAAFFFTLTPFILQLTFSPDYLKARLGVFPIDRLSALTDRGIIDYLFSPTWVMLAALLILFILRKRFIRLQHRLLIEFSCASVLLAMVLPNLSGFVLGRHVQPYHYFELFYQTLGYAEWFILIFLLQSISLWSPRFRSFGSKALVPGCILLVLTGGWLTIQRDVLPAASQNTQQRSWTNEGWSPLPFYRPDFARLVEELSKPEYDKRSVLGTFDHQVVCWWGSFREGFLYIPDPGYSLAPDDLIERRFLEFCTLVGLSSGNLASCLQNPEYLIKNFHSHSKYQAHRYYSFFPKEAYSNHEWERIRKSLFTWGLTIPAIERQRILDLFATQPQLSGRLDVVVLTKIPDYPGLRVNDPRFRKTFENQTFAVWVASESTR